MWIWRYLLYLIFSEWSFDELRKHKTLQKIAGFAISCGDGGTIHIYVICW